MGTVMTIMVMEWPIFLLIAAYLDQVLGTLQHTATRCNTRQHTATRCNALQRTATRCNTLQHAATHRNTPQPQFIATHLDQVLGTL